MYFKTARFTNRGTKFKVFWPSNKTRIERDIQIVHWNFLTIENTTKRLLNFDAIKYHEPLLTLGIIIV